MAQLTPQERLQIKIEEAELALKLAESAERAAQALTDQDDKLQKIKAATEQKLAAEERAVAAAKSQVALLTEELKLNGSLTDQQKDFLKNSLKVLQSSQLRLDNLKDILKAQEQQIKYQKIIAADADQILTKYFGITSETKQFGESLEQAGGVSNLLKDRLKKVKDEVGKIGGKALAVNAALNITKEIAKSITDVFLGQAKAMLAPIKEAVNFENAMEKGRSQIELFKMSARDLDILEVGGIEKLINNSKNLATSLDTTKEEIIEIQKGLYNSSGLFRELSASGDAAADKMIGMSQVLRRRLNVSLESSGEIATYFSQVLGKTSEESIGLTNSLAVMADEMGLNVQRVFSNAPAVMSTLARFNIPDLNKALLELAAVEQKTGLAADTMMGSLEKFTTFEGALTAAAELNASFGTTVDGMGIMDTVMREGPIEGFIKLRETLEESGIAIDQLNFAQLRQLGKSLGMLPEQMKRFGEISSQELRDITAGATTAAEAEKALAAAKGEGETMAEKQLKVTEKMTQLLETQIKLTYNLTSAELENLAASKERLAVASTAEKFKKPLFQAAGAVIGGIGGFLASGGNPLGALIGASAGIQGGGSLSESFAPGENYISKPTVAKVGEVGTENIIRAQQIPQTVASATGMTTVLNTGDKVTRNPTGGSPTNLTINLVGKEGTILDTSTQTISEGQMDKAISHYLNTKVSLLNS